MSTSTRDMAMNIWSISDKPQKLMLMKKFLETHGELTSKNDFIGFLVGEYRREYPFDMGTLDSGQWEE